MNSITTERLILRPFEESDRHAFASILMDPKVTQYTRYLGVRTMTDFDNQFDEHFRGGNAVYAITQKEDDTLIGFFEIHQGGEMTYALAQSAWGHGYVAEAGRTMMRVAFKELNLKEVIGEYADLNPNSGRVLAKIGLKPAGSLGSFELPQGGTIEVFEYRLTRDDWLADQKQGNLDD